MLTIAAYHAVSAMLAALGEQPRTHRGVDHLLQKELVPRGFVPVDLAARFTTLAQRRAAADYDASEHVDARELKLLLETARSLVDAAAAMVGA